MVQVGNLIMSFFTKTLQFFFTTKNFTNHLISFVKFPELTFIQGISTYGFENFEKLLHSQTIYVYNNNNKSVSLLRSNIIHFFKKKQTTNHVSPAFLKFL